MFQTDEKIRKEIITADGETEFQIRYMRDENVGLLTARSGKSYLILDSLDYWYDLIQEKYPSKQKCSCKNDYYKLYFDYIPRIGMEDYRNVELCSCCTECGKQRMFAEIDIDYSPTEQLFEQPLTFCEQPKIKYKVYSVRGYWKEEEFSGLIDFLVRKQLLIYCWYWVKPEKKRYLTRFTEEELKDYLFVRKNNYLHLYFSSEPLEELLAAPLPDENGIMVPRDIWRKNEIIHVNSPILVAAKGAGYFYSMDFCSEYLDAGQIKAKSELFSDCIREVLTYCRENLGK